MAQPLPRYEPLGVRVGSIQPIAPAAEESAARAASALADNLNRLSSFAFEAASAQARVEGAEYGAANAPTMEQLKKAQETGTDVMPGNTSSIFGRAARASALEQMKQNIEIEARSKISEFDATARRSDMSLEEYRKQMDSIVVGYSSALSQISPATSGSVRAALTVLTSSSYSAHAKHLYDKAQARDKIMVGQGIDNIIQNVDKIVQAGGRIQGEPGDEVFIPLENILASERNRVLQYAYRLGDAELAKTKMKEFTEQVNTSLRNSIVKWTIGEDGVPMIRKHDQIMRGDLSRTDIGGVWATMSEEERTKTKDEIRRQITAQNALESNMDAALERARAKSVQETRIEFISAWRDGDPDRQRAALEKMQSNGLRDAEGFEKYSSLIDTDGSRTQPGVVFHLENELARGRLSRDRVMDAVAERRLSYDDGRKLLDKVNAYDDRALASAMDFVKRTLGYPDRAMFNPSASERRAIQQVNTIQNEIIAKKMEAESQDRPFDAMAYATQRAADLRRSGPSEEDLRSAETRINGLRTVLKQKGFDIGPETPLEDVQRALAAANSRQTNERGYINPGNSGQYIQDLKVLLDATRPATSGAR
jgi:hypothetical protein